MLVALALCYSARLILYGEYACNERYSSELGRSSAEARVQQDFLAGIFEVAGQVGELVRRLLDSVELDGDGLSPLLCHCLFAVAEECEWFVLEQEDASAGVWLRDVVELLRVIGRRWGVAGVYLSEIYRWPGYNSLIL